MHMQESHCECFRAGFLRNFFWSAREVPGSAELCSPQRALQNSQVGVAMVLPAVSEKKFTKDYPKLKIVVTGAGGFIGSHLGKRLKEEGHFVRAVDWKENEYMEQSAFCDEFMNLDLRWPENCKKAVEGCDWCFNLAVRLRPMPPPLPVAFGPWPSACAFRDERRAGRTLHPAR